MILKQHTNWAYKALPEILKALPNVFNDVEDLKPVFTAVETQEDDLSRIKVVVGTPEATYSLVIDSIQVFDAADTKDCEAAVEFEWLIASGLRDLIDKNKAYVLEHVNDPPDGVHI